MLHRDYTEITYRLLNKYNTKTLPQKDCIKTGSETSLPLTVFSSCFRLRNNKREVRRINKGISMEEEEGKKKRNDVKK